MPLYYGIGINADLSTSDDGDIAAVVADPADAADGEIVFDSVLGLMRQKLAGVWGDLQPPSATGEELYDGTYPAADHAGRSRFVTTWGLWTLNEWFTSDGSQWYPESRVLRLADPDVSATTTSGSNVSLIADVFPANMLRGAYQMRSLIEWLYTGTGAVKNPRAWFGASGAGTGGTTVYGVATAAGNLHTQAEVIMTFDSNSAEHFMAFSASTTARTSSGARGTAAVDVTAACEMAFGGNCTGPDTLQVASRLHEVIFPSRKT